MEKEYNIWDLERVHIKIKSEYLKKINEEIIKKFKIKRKAHEEIFKEKEIPWSSFKNILKQSHIKYFFVPLEIYLRITDNLGISREELQNNIIAYKTAGGVNFIENPILPIKITPVFDMLMAHHIGDGTVINPKKGRLPYFGYRQFDRFYRTEYIRKIENIFGKIKFLNGDYFENSTRPYCPPVLSSLFFKHYNVKIEDFLSTKARIPELVFYKENKNLLAILIGFIIDEGNIDSTEIVISLKNKLLIEDLDKLCKILEYESKITQSRYDIKNDMFRLNILRDGMKKLYSDYLILNREYLVIDLGRKGEKIEQSLKIYNRNIYKTKGNNELIFEILKSEQLSVNQLAQRINMTRQGVRFHIHKLIKEGKIKIIDNKQANWIYGIK